MLHSKLAPVNSLIASAVTPHCQAHGHEGRPRPTGQWERTEGERGSEPASCLQSGRGSHAEECSLAVTLLEPAFTGRGAVQRTLMGEQDANQRAVRARQTGKHAVVVSDRAEAFEIHGRCES